MSANSTGGKRKEYFSGQVRLHAAFDETRIQQSSLSDLVRQCSDNTRHNESMKLFAELVSVCFKRLTGSGLKRESQKLGRQESFQSLLTSVQNQNLLCMGFKNQECWGRTIMRLSSRPVSPKSRS